MTNNTTELSFLFVFKSLMSASANIIFGIVLIFIFTNDSLASNTKPRMALVIGNGEYEKNYLRNPINDAEDFSKLLRTLDFKVVQLTNADRREMENAIRKFGADLKKLRGVGLFYYAGHGVQVEGRNYLIPVKTIIESESDVKFEAVDAGRVLGKMQDAGNAINIVILDACRDNPFARSFRSISRGLGQVQAPKGSFIAYATAPGTVASDGNGRNGIFTKHLMKHLVTPGLTIEQVMNRTRFDVSSKTKDKQIPWHSSSLTGDLVLLASSSATFVDTSTKKGPLLTVNANVTGAEIFLNHKKIGKTPIVSHPVVSGTFILEVKKPGYETYLKKIHIRKNREQKIFIELMIKSEKSRLFVETIPENVDLSFKNSEQIFYQGVALDPGNYRLTISKEGYDLKEKVIEMKHGEDTHIQISLKPKTKATDNKKSRINTWLDSLAGIEFVWIPAGCYQMGQSEGEKDYLFERIGEEKYSDFMDEIPKHEVCLNGFWMSRYEITNHQFRQFKSDHHSGMFKGISLNGDNQPVVGVSWDEANAFASWLSDEYLTNYQFRLPTEAEWEHGCRAGTDKVRYWGDGSDTGCAFANVHDRTSKRKNEFDWNEHSCDDLNAVSAPVGTYQQNSYGLNDMLGNVWEWCADTYLSDSYKLHDTNNPKVTGEGQKVIRGGSWMSTPENVRCAGRNGDLSDSKGIDLGFRLVMVP